MPMGPPFVPGAIAAMGFAAVLIIVTSPNNCRIFPDAWSRAGGE